MQSIPIITLLGGTRVSIEQRLPREGERYWTVSDDSYVADNYGLDAESVGRWNLRIRKREGVGTVGR